MTAQQNAERNNGAVNASNSRLWPLNASIFQMVRSPASVVLVPQNLQVWRKDLIKDIGTSILTRGDLVFNVYIQHLPFFETKVTNGAILCKNVFLLLLSSEQLWSALNTSVAQNLCFIICKMGNGNSF